MRYKYSQNLTEASEMTFAENEYQGIEQNGTMKRIPTTKVKQGVHNATHDHVDFATNPVADTNTVGRLLWDDDAKTLSIVRDNTGGTKVSVEIGDDIQRRVKNTTGATILNGQPVYTTSALGNTPLIALADGDDPAKNRVTGLMTADIANNGVSYLTTVGLVRNVPIANIIDPADGSWTVGTYLYLSTVTGKLTKNRPLVDIAVRVGIITDISGSNCTILVYLRDDYTKIFDDIDNAITAIKGTGYTEGSLKTHEDRLDTLEGTGEGSVAKAIDDALEPFDARVDSTELTLARQGQDLASVKQTLQQGNGATLDFSDIGIVPLDARATGRANPTVEGRTATNLVVNGNVATSLTSDASATPIYIKLDGTWAFSSIGITYNPALYQIYNGKTGDKILCITKLKAGSVGRVRLNRLVFPDGTSTDAPAIADSLYMADIITMSKDGPFHFVQSESTAGLIERDYQLCINLTSIYGAGNEPSASDCAKIFSYFDGTKSISMPARVRSVGKNGFIANKVVTGAYVISDYGATSRYDQSTGTVTLPQYASFAVDVFVKAGNNQLGFDTSQYLNVGDLRIFDKDEVLITSNAGFVPVGMGAIPFTSEVTGVVKILIGIVRSGETLLSNLTISSGDVAFPYEPYQDSTLYIADDSELNSVPAITDEVKVVNGELVKVQNIAVGALGSELITNGGFNTDANWGTHTHWSIEGGKANFLDTGDGYLNQNFVMTAGKLYKISLEFSGVTDARIAIGNQTGSYFGNSIIGGYQQITSDGSKTYYVIPSSSATGIRIYGNVSGATYSIDNFSIKEVATTAGTPKAITSQTQVSDDGTNGYYQLATPIITPLLTSGILQAKPKGTVYWEPYYEGSHQTNSSSQITLPYTGTIDKLTGYDENLEPYEIPSTGYTLVGTLLTITGAEENEVFYVELSRSEPLAPEMTINTLNNDQVTLDSVNGKYYKITFTTANGVPTTVATEVV